MAAAIDAPVSVMDTAGEGGAWGIALLAAYMLNKLENEKLDDYLAKKVFTDKIGTTINPDSKDVEGFNNFIKRYSEGLAIERAAIENFKL